MAASAAAVAFRVPDDSVSDVRRTLVRVTACVGLKSTAAVGPPLGLPRVKDSGTETVEPMKEWMDEFVTDLTDPLSLTPMEPSSDRPERCERTSNCWEPDRASSQ